jgi:hypothetical protein
MLGICPQPTQPDSNGTTARRTMTAASQLATDDSTDVAFAAKLSVPSPIGPQVKYSYRHQSLDAIFSARSGISTASANSVLGSCDAFVLVATIIA